MNLLSANQTTEVPPNILLIVMDATRAKNLSCHGYHRPTTPNLERFAERSVVYETAISTAGWTLPTHASIFTGLYPCRQRSNMSWRTIAPKSKHMSIWPCISD